ncbi:MAG: ferrous iron transport protein B [Clostridia bacterium]
MKFALAGNPNSGKTTLFNYLTGSTAHVGNWPGVTVDKKEGIYKKLPEKVTVLDLPGIYSLSPYTPEEIVARTYILDEKPDVVINIVDATNLERNLYLTTQLLELDRPLIIALNMIDAVDRSGDKIDIESLEKAIGVPVVAISALRGKGVKELMQRAYATAKEPFAPYSVLSKSAAGEVFNRVADLLKNKNIDNPIFHAVKLIEGDELEVKNHLDIISLVNEIKSAYPAEEFDGDFEAVVADARYKYITERFSKLFKKAPRKEELTRSDKIDKVLTHKFFGIPIFLAIMFAVFHITFSGDFLYLSWYGVEPVESLGVFLQSQLGNLMGIIMDAVSDGLESAAPWVSSLLVDGLLSGLDAVLSFLPQILLLYLFLSILEDSGYMARVAFIMDRAFRRFGMSGKAFLPLLMCFGCAVPGIIATRALENERERRIAITISPFFSCGAKLPIWGTFAATMFLNRGGEVVVFGMYVLGLAVAILLSILMHKMSKKKDVAPFIMELPAYRLPQPKSTAIHLWQKLKHYVVRVATIIAGAIVVIWALSTFNFRFEMVEDNANSIIGIISRGIQWLFVPLGFGMGESGWKFVVAAFTGLIAKEMVVATMGVFAGMDADPLEMEAGELAATPIALLISTLSIPAGLAFMAFNLLSVPCMAAVGAASGELRSRKKLWSAIAIWMGTAYVVAAAIYWIGTYWWIGLILAVVLAVIITYFALKKKGIDIFKKLKKA